MVDPIHCLPSNCQNVWLFLRISTHGRDSGMLNGPSRSTRRGGCTRADDSSGT